MAISSTFESGVNGNNILAADAGSVTPWDAVVVGTGTGALIKYDNAQKYGNLAATVYSGSPAAGGNYLEWSTAFGTQTNHYGRLYLYHNGGWATTKFIDFLNGGTACAFYLRGDRRIEIRDTSDATVIGTMTTGLTLNSWNRIEWHIVHSATVGQVEVKTFLGANADGSTPDETYTSAATQSIDPQVSAIRFGVMNGDIVTTWFDNIVAAATSYPGPLLAPIQTKVQQYAVSAGGRGY